MKIGLTLSILCMMLILSSFAALAAEQDVMQSPAWGELISIDINDLPLEAALESIIKPTGASCSIDPDIKFVKIPSVSFNQVTRTMALKSITRVSGAVYRIEGNTIVVTAKPGTASPWAKHVSVDAHDAPLGTVLSEMFKSTGLSFAVDSGVANLVVKSVKLTDVAFSEALYKVLNGAGATYNGTQGVVQIVPKSLPAAQNNPAKPEAKETSPTNITVTDIADNADPWLKRVNVDMKNALLANAVEELVKGRSINFAVDMYAGHLIVKSLELTDVTLREALDRVVNDAGAVYRIDNGIVIIESKSALADQKQLISLNLKDMSLSKVIEELFKVMGLNYTIDPDIKELRVTATLANVPFDKALDSLLSATGLTYSIDNGVYHISSKPNAAAAPASGNNLPALPAQSNAKAPEKEIELRLLMKVTYLDKDADVWGPVTIGLNEGGNTKISINIENQAQYKGAKQLNSLLYPVKNLPRWTPSLISASLTPTTLKDGSVQISGTIDYTKDDCNAHGIKILAVLKPGKAQTLPEIPIPSVNGNTRAVMKLTLTATLVKRSEDKGTLIN